MDYRISTSRESHPSLVYNVSRSTGHSELSDSLLLSGVCLTPGERSKEEREAGVGLNMVQGSWEKSKSKGIHTVALFPRLVSHTDEAGAKGNVM